MLKHEGFTGHEWFLRNLDLFDEDWSVINKAMENVIKEAVN